MEKKWDIVVRRTGRTWSVYGIARADGKVITEDLIEGGFFTRFRAEACRSEVEKQCLQDEIEKAEKKAGWDATP